MNKLPWKSPMPEAEAHRLAKNLFAKKLTDGFVTADEQRVLLTYDEVVELIGCYWTDDE